MSAARKALTVLIAFAVSASVARATWSIVIVDARTGEVGLGIASCVNGDLKDIGVIAVGHGGGATQAASPPGNYRVLLFNELLRGTPPDLIVELMQDLGSADESRQHGIADRQRRAATFTGHFCADWAGGRSGRVGSIAYAVQGNVMVAEAVIAMAERAVLTTPGDVAEKLMAAMEAARAQGGDKRCTKYGKSAENGFMVAARIGDIDARCQGGDDCANGTYFLDLNVKDKKSTDPDPVLLLEQMFQAWRASWIGRPDHLNSTVGIQPQLTPADGTTVAQMTVTLVDWQNKLVGHGGARVIVTHAASSAGSCAIGNVIDNNDGSYTIPLTAGTRTGGDVFEVVVDDGVSPVRLYPDPSMTLGAPLRLRSTVTEVSAAAGDDVPLKLHTSVPFIGRNYLVLVSASGTDPGFDVGKVHMPLNIDAVLDLAWIYRNRGPFKNTEGKIDDFARAEATLAMKPGDLDLLVGATLSFAFFTRDPDDFASEVAQVKIIP